MSDFYIGAIYNGEVNILTSPFNGVNPVNGGDQVAHFLPILVAITTSITDDISHDHPELPRCKYGYATAVRSCDVIKGHQFCLPITSYRKSYTTVHCVIVFSSSRRIEWSTFWHWGHVKVTWPEVNWWPWSSEVILYIFQCIATRWSRWCCFSLKVLRKKTPLFSRGAIWTFLIHVTSFLTWP